MSSRRILIVDDEPDITQLVRIVLEERGYTCREVHKADKVMEEMATFRPDLVVLDVMLPGESGFMLCWRIKNTPAFRKVPVLLLSAKSQEADHKMGHSMRADAYLDKPFTNSTLLAEVERLLTAARA